LKQRDKETKILKVRLKNSQRRLWLFFRRIRKCLIRK